MSDVVTILMDVAAVCRLGDCAVEFSAGAAQGGAMCTMDLAPPFIGTIAGIPAQ